jgi:hypothetical protein
MRRQRPVPFFYGWVLVAIGFLTIAVGVNVSITRYRENGAAFATVTSGRIWI